MPRGFHNLTPEKRKEIASKGGQTARDKGTARRWTTEQAREAGKKGGQMKAENSEKRKQNG